MLDVVGTNPILALIALAGGIVAMIAIAARLRTAILVLGVMVFATSISVPYTDGGAIKAGWLLPLQAMRSELFLGGGLLLTIAAFAHAGSMSIRRTTAQPWWLLAIMLYQGLLIIYHDSVVFGLETIAGALVTILPMAFIVPAVARTERDWMSLIRAIGFAHVAWVGASGVQFIRNPSVLLSGWYDRFIGVAGNPQYAALAMSIGTVVIFWLLLNDEDRRLRWLWIGTFGVALIMLIGSGSRMGGGMAVIGFMACLYRRLGRAVLWLPVVALVVWLAYKVVMSAGVGMGFQRLTSLENTRTSVWVGLLELGFESPLIGNGLREAHQTENSFLLGFAAFGVVMLVLMAAYTIVSVVLCLRLWRISFAVPEWRPYIDLILGFNAMYFAGAMLEGFILARANPGLMGMMIFTGLAGVIVWQYRGYAAEEGEIEYADDDGYALEEGYAYDDDYGEAAPAPHF
jgi:hypothetical protein